MNNQRRTILIAAIGCCFVMLIALPVNAAPGNGYEITWWTVNGGGAMSSTGGTYSLGGTIGQPDAGTSSGGSYTLTGGFWLNDLSQLYLPLILR